MPSLREVALVLPVFLLPALAAPQGVKLLSREMPAPLTSYKCFGGTQFPSEWLSWDQLLAINKPALSAGNSPETVDNIISAIQSVAAQATPQILPEFVLAQIMQESGGDLSHVGDNGKSIGLMQVQIANPVQCDPGACTKDDIVGMLQQSILGHKGAGAPQSPGVAYDLANNVTPAALRVYNTGHLPDPSNYQTATACSTSSYVSDIGNRLLGLSPNGFPSPADLNTNCGFMPATTC